MSEKYSNIKFHENPYSGGQVVPCGWRDGRTDMTMLIVAFRNFPHSPKNVNIRAVKDRCISNHKGNFPT